jgi:hypothetical protein
MTARNVRTAEFKKMFERLPSNIQQLAAQAFARFKQDPNHPLLNNHPLADTGKGRHKRGSRSVWVSQKYRAIYVNIGDANIWYWIGSHADYDNFVGRI